MVLSLLFALQVHAGGTGTALQEPGNRQDDREGQTGDEEAGEAAVTWCRGEWQVDVPQTNADHTRHQFRESLN